MSELNSVARPYAKAAFEYALDTKALNEWAQMLQFCAAVVADVDMSALLDNPRVSADNKKSALLSVCAGKLATGGQNFLEMLAANHRLAALPEICALFLFTKAEHEKSAQVQITSASTLSDAEKKLLTDKLSAKWGKTVAATFDVDAALIGGAVIRGNDVVIDGSVRGKLSRLAATLQA